ncbi:MAG TPA: hypothetical protein VLE72_01965 [Candidatus Saccharimonadales bacterium]|nr:hypothetical protein [Candidatus Saccharimonadales bacterium]
MSVIAELLLAKEPLLDYAIEQLEDITQNQGIDAKLTAEIAEKSAERLLRLNLKPDSSGPEIYESLLRIVARHDEHLAKTLGGQDPTSIPEMIPLIVAKVQALDLPKRGFFLKESVAREMLVAHPPTNVMQRLGYSDINQLLERENLYEVYLSLRFGEEADWLNQFDDSYKSLQATDFETRDLNLVVFDPTKWGDIAEHFIQKKRHNITHSKEMGAIGVMPMTALHMRGITLKVLPLLVHYYNEVHLYSAFFKLMKTKRNFGEIVATTLIADPPRVRILGHKRVHWRIIQRYYGKLPKEHHPEQFEPHVQPEDLHWRKAEEVLYQTDPELEFWRDLDYVAVIRPSGTVTFNLMDISLSYSNQIAYADRYLYHFREALWNELFARYLGEKTLEAQVLERLDNDVIAPEELV